MIKDVSIPPHVFHGILPLKGNTPGDKNLRVFGGDTETVRGDPHTVQIAGPDDHAVLFVTAETIFPEFWGWIKGRMRHNGVNLCYFHNLNFDIRVLFNHHLGTIYRHFNDIRFKIGNAQIKMLFGKVNKVDIQEGQLHLQVLDSKAFTQASLKKSLKMFGVPQKKLPMPEGLGQRRLISKEFKEYALQDAIAVRHLGLRIMDIHKEYGVRPAITLPSFAARVFRRHFLKIGESVPFPPIPCVKASEKSYHGGKNCYVCAGPEVFEDVFEVDISSAYPYAMRELPPMDRGEFRRVGRFDSKKAGVYRISGRTNGGPYSLVFTDGFEPFRPREVFKDIWITGYELAELRKTDAKVRVEEGYVWVPGKGARNPFARYVDHFYQKKQSSAKDDPNYHFYKIALNALYGKLVATHEEKSMTLIQEVERLKKLGLDIPDDFKINERFDPVLGETVRIVGRWRAGAMYNPFWASQITGHTRAYLYRLESSLKAFHSATDSVKSFTPHPPVPGLGGLKVECFGRCYVFRNKLYLHCSRSGEFCGHDEPPIRYPEARELPASIRHKAGEPMVDEDGQHLCKVALHAYEGPIWKLWEDRYKLMRGEPMEYSYNHVIGLREGLRQRQKPCLFVERRKTLDLSASV